jgi:soluble lytic murein transglycosylase-like protein
MLKTLVLLFGLSITTLIIAVTSTETAHIPPDILKPSLVAAIISVESSGNPKAISKKGAYGLMQIRHKVWAKDLKAAGIIKTKSDLFDPDTNIKAGSFILVHYLRKNNGNVRAALTAYSGKARGYADKVKKAGGFNE